MCCAVPAVLTVYLASSLLSRHCWAVAGAVVDLYLATRGQLCQLEEPTHHRVDTDQASVVSKRLHVVAKWFGTSSMTKSVRGHMASSVMVLDSLNRYVLQ